MSEEQKPKEGHEGRKKEDNVVFVGKKPTMSYVLAVMTQFSDGANEVHLKARGRSISSAVDIAEAVRNKFIHSLERTVEIGTEQIVDERNNKLNISTIDIKLTK